MRTPKVRPIFREGVLVALSLDGGTNTPVCSLCGHMENPHPDDELADAYLFHDPEAELCRNAAGNHCAGCACGGVFRKPADE